MEKETFCPASRKEWRTWLEENHQTKQAVWLIYYKKKSNAASISYSDAVDEALCFGWIDSTRKSLGEDQFTQFFCKRKPQSGWSKVNKEKITRLTAAGLMTPAGFKCIELAKQNGSWSILDEVEELIVPADLDNALAMQSGAKDFFLSLSKSLRKQMLQWLVLAKRPETRQRRIKEIVEAASRQEKLKIFF
ncbi:YdeI/OmpD-associated family protein [Pedobacter sp. SAFR-022]|uniref:YdeI/OmpD-associated family protein n=1 Tax=Pedobacter sp. SAFR-022 TaxID=3436861 RepID=UPI003F7ED1DE